MAGGIFVLMIVKILGSALVVAGCGGFGFKIAASRRKEEKMLRNLISALDFMECELQYRMSALPDLCRSTAAECSGQLQVVFRNFSTELEDQISPDVSSCMRAVLAKHAHLPSCTYEALCMLGESLGRFDMIGQLKGLEAVRAECRRKLNILSTGSDVVVRSYQTLGLCAGAAVVILLI